MDLIKEAVNTASWRYDCVKEEELFQKSPPQEMNGIVCLSQKELQNACPSDWGFFEEQQALGEVAKRGLPQSKWADLDFSAHGGEIPALILTTFMTLGNSASGSNSLLNWKMGLKTDAHKDHRNWGQVHGMVLEIWQVLQMLFLKECMVKWRVSFGVRCGF